MLAAQRRKMRSLNKARARQAFHRERLKDKGLAPLQVRISVYAHHKATMLSEATGLSLTDIYQRAIEQADKEALAPIHEQPSSEELLGHRQITPWLDADTLKKFEEEVAPSYRTRRSAISATVFQYAHERINE
jgi:hypothetical protein